MLKNFATTSLRALKKHISTSILNIAGLGLSLSVCLLLTSWILEEVSYDSFHSHRNQIYRVSLEYSMGGQTARTSVSPTALTPALLALPETEQVVKVYPLSGIQPIVVKVEEQMFEEKKFYFADSSFFKVFSFSLLQGNPQTALAAPYSVVLTASSAKKYFGDEDPMGKSLYVNNNQHYLVTGVMEDVATHSTLQFDMVASFNSLNVSREPVSWWSANYQTFVLLKEGANAAFAAEKVNDVVRKEVGASLPGSGDYVKYIFFPLTRLHLYSDFENEPEVTGDVRYVYTFAAIAFLILLIACINYVNLSTAMATARAKEIAIRKVTGASGKQLFFQFIGESVVIALLALLVGFALSVVLVPLFNSLTDKHFTTWTFLNGRFIFSAAASALVLGFLAGIYPALFLTNFKPVAVLRGKFKSSSKGLGLRRVLVVFQFAVSAFLIIATGIILQQLNYIQHIRLGYDREQVITIPLDRKSNEVFSAFKSELIRLGYARFVARASESPVLIAGGYSMTAPPYSENATLTQGLAADEDFISCMEIKLLHGRNFTPHDLIHAQRDTSYSFIVNETALTHLNIPVDKAIGSMMDLNGRKGKLIGVVKDFHINTMHSPITPLVIFPEEAQLSRIFIKLPPGDPAAHLKNISAVARSLMDHRPFDAQFLDDAYQQLYQSEQRMGTAVGLFAMLAILIGTLGLLGLVAFSAAQRTKEMGIRKVLGASVAGLIGLITGEYMRLIFIATLIGTPIAIWIMGNWLENFHYRVSINWIIVLLAPTICLVVALGTAAGKAIQTALINPVNSLRNE